jgi:predicted aldo/keto reductase-like oxidoreductase
VKSQYRKEDIPKSIVTGGRTMDRIKKNFGFGYMRLPMLENGEVDKEQT